MMDEEMMTHIASAKACALGYVQEARVWVVSTPVEWESFRQLLKAIALELFEQADLMPKQKDAIQKAFPLFQPDPALQRWQKVMEAVSSDPELQKLYRQVCEQVIGGMEEGV